MDDESFFWGRNGRSVFDPSGGTEGGVAFWPRRIFGEITVHRLDAALILGRSSDTEPELAAAAIDDRLATMASSGWAANVPGFADAMRGDGQTIAWVPDDMDQVWLLQRTDAPLVLTRDLPEDGRVDVTIHGPTDELLRVVSRRRPLNEAVGCRVDGDRTELAHLIEHMDWVAG